MIMSPFSAGLAALLATVQITANLQGSGSGSATTAGVQPTVVSPVTVQARRPDGHATMRCIVKVTGQLRNCELLSEDPPGKGFGQATLKTARMFRMKPAMRDGKPIEAIVIIPLRWVDGVSANRPVKPSESPAPASNPPTVDSSSRP